MKNAIIPLMLFLLFACQTKKDIDPSDIEQIKLVLADQLEAWNNGDHEGFMQGYWSSDELRFCGRRGTTYGWQTTLNNYKKSFPNRDDMRTLRFELDSFYTARAPQVSVDGRWIIDRQDTSFGGYFVLLFDRPDGKHWKIIEDHTW